MPYLGLLRSCSVRLNKMLYSFLKLIAFFLFKVFFNIKIYGRENIPKTGQVIIAGNHLSYLDPILLGVAVNRKLNFIARDSLFKNVFFAKFLKMINTFPLKKEGIIDLRAIKEALSRLKSGGAVVIFPEGTRSIDGKLKEGLSGVGMIASKAGCPVVPAFIKGTDKAFPVGAKFIKFKSLSVYFGRQIFPDKSFDKKSYKELSQRVMDGINKLNLG